MIRAVVHEIRYGVRSLVRRRGFTVMAILTLALGIGGATASLVLVDRILVRPLPYKDSSRLVSVWSANPDRRGQRGWDRGWISFPEFDDVGVQQTSFEGLSLTASSKVSLLSGAEPQRIDVGYCNWTLFPILGTQALAGRFFSADDDRIDASRTIVLSHPLWRQHFGADPNILGKSVYLDESGGSTAYTVIGILPPNFHFKVESFFSAAGKVDVTIDGSPDLAAWIPINVRPGLDRKERGNHSFTLIGRLKPGISISAAQDEIARLNPGTDHRSPHGAHITTRYEQETETSRGPVWVLFAAAGLLLLVACGNVGNLLLGELSSRKQEIAVRTALGASWRRITSQLLTESALLSIAGGLAGLPIAIWAIRTMVLLAPRQLPRFAEIGVDFHFFAAMLIAASFAALAFGLAPILVLRRSGMEMHGGRLTPRSSVQNVIVIGEIALSFVLLVSAGLLARSVVALSSVDPGFQSRDLLVIRPSAPLAKYRGRMASLYSDLLQRVLSVPGVVGASQISIQPFGPGAQDNYIEIEGRPLAPGERGPLAFRRTIRPNYFDVVGTPMLAGRAFTDADNTPNGDAAIVNRAFAQQIWPAENPLGKRIRVDGRWRDIVGIVNDTKVQGLRQNSGIVFYLPQAPGNTGQNTFVIRTAGRPMDFSSAIKNAFWSVEHEITFEVFDTSDSLIAASLAEDRYRPMLIGAFAIAAGVLAALGLYSVITRSIAQRTREFGVRIALGAASRDIVRMVIHQTMKLTLIGVAFGIAGALAATRVLRTILFGVTPTNIPTYMGIVVVILFIGLIASWQPARGAARVDPIQTLRSE